jgi:hypothetical protein
VLRFQSVCVCVLRGNPTGARTIDQHKHQPSTYSHAKRTFLADNDMASFDVLAVELLDAKTSSDRLAVPIRCVPANLLTRVTHLHDWGQAGRSGQRTHGWGHHADRPQSAHHTEAAQHCSMLLDLLNHAVLSTRGGCSPGELFVSEKALAKVEDDGGRGMLLVLAAQELAGLVCGWRDTQP